MPLADAHIHLFSGGYAGRLGASPAGGDELEAYERLRANYQIKCALVVGYEGEARYAGNSREIFSLALERPWIFPLPFLAVAAPPPAVAELRSWREQGAVGYSIYLKTESDGIAFGNWPGNTLAELSAQSAILSFNATPGALARAKEAIVAIDGARVIFSHLGLPGRSGVAPTTTQARERLQPLLELAPHPNVAVKLSGLYAVSDPPYEFPNDAAQPFVDVLLDTFGPLRMMWGSDFSPVLDYLSFAQVADPQPLYACTPAEVQNVMGLNLLRMLNDS
jgi:L-fuconolactonase